MRISDWSSDVCSSDLLLMIEATNDSYHLPDKGLVGRHAIFDPAMLDSPVMDQAFRAQQTPDGREEPWKVDIKRRGAISTVTYPYKPLDAVRWKGDLTPGKQRKRGGEGKGGEIR